MSIKIYDNTIGSSLFNIHTLHNLDHSSIEVFNNHFDLPVLTGANTGGNVLLDEGLATNINVYNDTIHVQRGMFGVQARNNHHTSIYSNHVDVVNNGSLYGIGIEGGDRNSVECNNVQSKSGFVNPNQAAISVNTSPSAEVGNNFVDAVNIGINFSGSCAGANILLNSINTHMIGLQENFSPIIGWQINKGNTWDGTCSVFEAAHFPPSGPLVSNDQFFYQNGIPNNFPSSINTSTQWFSFNANADLSRSTYTCAPPVAPPGNIKPEDYIIAQNQLDPNTEYPEQNYESRRYLIEKLKQDPTLLQIDPILNAYYEQNINNNLGKFASTSIDIKDALKWQAVYYSVYITNLNSIESKSDSIILINDSLLTDSTNQALKLKLNQLNSDIKTLTISNRNIQDITDKLKETSVLNLIPENYSLIDAEVNESNELVVNDIYLRTLALGRMTLTNDQISDLQNIIFQCPFSGGEAVYKARILYSLVDDSISYDDYDLCILQGIAPRHSKPQIENNVKLFPNPANSQATLTYHLEENEKGVFQIIDQMGRLIYVKVLNEQESNVNIDLSLIPSGIYTYQLIVNDAVLTNKLFSVMK